MESEGGLVGVVGLCGGVRLTGGARKNIRVKARAGGVYPQEGMKEGPSQLVCTVTAHFHFHETPDLFLQAQREELVHIH